MPKPVKDREKDNLTSIENVHIKNALAEYLVDAKREPSDMKASLSLVSDILPYLMEMDPVWSGIDTIKLNSNDIPCKPILDAVKSKLRSADSLKL